MIRTRWMALLAFVPALLVAGTQTPLKRGLDFIETPGKKYAVLIGIKTYDNVNFSNLEYTERDVVELAKVLTPQGYQVTLLSDSQGPKLRPDRANILKHLDEVLDQCKRDDLILVAFAGHGVQFENDKASYFCPLDAKPTRAESMISLKALYERLEDCGAGTKLMLVDACRVKVKQERFRGVDGDNTPPPPKGVSVFFSCSAGQAALELNELKHGLFFYHVLEGLRGKAKSDDDYITWLDLARYATRRVKNAGYGQVPVLKGEIADGPVVRVESENHPKEIVNSIGMKLVYIPPGKFWMGSPPVEKDRHPAELAHEVEITKGFFMGKYEVTQAEYEKIMGKNLSNSKGVKLPVEQVSWYDAKEFCRNLSAKEGKTYYLPSEAEWEYACRAGTNSAYHFGETIASAQANFQSKGTKAVGSYPPNAWGLHDMHGNVWEWCEDWHGDKYYEDSPRQDPSGPSGGSNRLFRGGSHYDVPRYCRSANRDWVAPTHRSGSVGLRLALRFVK